MFSLSSLSFTIASLVTLALIYFKLPSTTLQQITAFLLVIMLIVTSRFVHNYSKPGGKKIWYLLSLGVSSFFVQILILATGGIYSSFLILIHLYTLGSSFLLNLSSAISFLILTLLLLITHIYLNPQMLALFRDDPGSAILYFASFIVIIPLAQYLMYSYHLKDALLKTIKEYAETGEQREQSILNNINELVIVTDRDLKILSTNEATEQSLNLEPNNYLNHPALEVVPLKDKNNQPLTAKDLSLSQILEDKVTRIVDGFFYQAPNDPKPRPVAIQIRPVTSSTGNISQLIFIITDPQRQKNLELHSDLQEAITKQKLLIEGLKNTLTKAGLRDTISQLELISKTETDLLLAYELEEHSIQPKPSPEDMAVLGRQILLSKQGLAQTLGVKLQFELPKEETAEADILHLLDINVVPQALPLSPFMATVDKRWFTAALQKILDISILLASEKANQQVNLLVSHNQNTHNIINITVTLPYHTISNKEIEELFVEYYSDLAIKSNLRLGNGLEGFIAKNILNQLNIPMEAKFDQSTPSLIFTFNIVQTLPPVS